MFLHAVTANFDTEFPAPADCPRHGDVACRVVRADCRVIDAWDVWITFEISLLLRITVRSGERCCTFFKERRFRETVMADRHTRVDTCDVTAVACRCVIQRGRVHCNLTAKVAFTVKDRCRCGCMHHSLCRCHSCKHHDFRSCGRPRHHDHGLDGLVFHGRKHHHHFVDFSGHDGRHRCRHCGGECDCRHDDRFDEHDCRKRDHACTRRSFQEAVIHVGSCRPYRVIQWS